MNRLWITFLLVAHILLIPLSCYAGDRAAPLPEPMKYCITPLSILFDIDRDNIRGEYLGQIDTVGLLMQIYPSTTAIIEGHADDKYFSPNHTSEVVNLFSDLKLSQRRAEGVMNYLVKKFSIPPYRLAAEWYGNTRREPKAAAENRRVSVILDCPFLKER